MKESLRMIQQTQQTFGRRSMIAPQCVNEVIKVQNKEKLVDKIYAMKEDGTDRLRFISDFDMTMTRDAAYNRWAHSTFACFEKCRFVTRDYRK